MRIARLNHTAPTLCLCTLACLLLAAPSDLPAAGVTLITHGNGGTTSGWVTGMADALSARLGGNVPIYRIDVTDGGGGLVTDVTKISGGDPLTSTAGELIIMLDWGPVSSGGTTTFDVVDVVAPLFGQTNLLADLGGHALAEIPIHILGHSRGGSLVCELSKQLGASGIWVDQVTGLDTHPIDGDAPVASYETVLCSDSYYETDSFLHLVDGERLPGSFWRKQVVASGGYSFPYDWHSDVHLWYHGTIDLAIPTTNGDIVNGNPITITSTMREGWWTAVEEKGTNAGFIYSRLGGGDRLSTVQPNGADSTPIRNGFNRYYDVGDGTDPNNRTAVGSNSGEWPNPIRFDLLSTNVIDQGDTSTFEIYFQWAQPTNSIQTIHVLADPDLNPLNGNEILLDEGFASGTTVAQVGQGTIDVQLDGTAITAGDYHVLVEMAAGGRRRILYAAQSLQVTTGTQPLVLDIAASTNSMVLVGINGVAGQTAVLEMSVDALPWMPIATNTLTSARWEVVKTLASGAGTTLYRAVLLTQ